MRLENSKAKQKAVSTAILVAFSVYVLLSLACIFAAAGQVRDLPTSGVVSGQVGPFKLFDIQKTLISGGGFSLEFSAKPGLLVLALCCGIFGCGLYLFLESRSRS